MVLTVVAQVGGKLELLCKARGRRMPRYRQLKNGVELVSSKLERFLADHPVQSIFFIEELEGENAGNYTC